jgi:ABC-2 type transport system ATP-binding protein
VEASREHDPQVRLSFDGLRKTYGGTVALEGLSLEVLSGEIFGLIGPDGAGKTTAMRIACCLVPPDGGRAEIMGFDVTKQPMSVKDHIGYMPQRFSLYPDLTVAENLRFFADLYEVPRAERLEREKRLMQFSRLEPFRNRRAGQLSGGMKQKLALSCTLIHTPDVLILDEPTTGVDPLSRQEFWNILRDLAASGQALLVSTPYMDEAQLCHRVALMHRGKALAIGTPDDVPRKFARRLMEVIGEGVDGARRALAPDAELGKITVARFGDRLHVVYDTDDQARAIIRRLGGQSVTWKPIAPTMEDTFVSLMGNEEQPS